jgi:hypothetical protein
MTRLLNFVMYYKWRSAERLMAKLTGGGGHGTLSVRQMWISFFFCPEKETGAITTFEKRQGQNIQ